MKLHRNCHSPVLSLAAFAAALGLVAVTLFVSPSFAAERPIYAFAGGNDGIGPNDLIADRAGNLYGTTFNGGGSAGAGTVYKLSPPAQQGGQWSETVLYSFSYSFLF